MVECSYMNEVVVSSSPVAVTVNLQFKHDFKTVELLTKRSFFLHFRDSLENDEGNKRDV